MKIFLINLDRNVDRFKSVDERLQKCGVKYERFSAVYGKVIPPEELRRRVSYFRWWCVSGLKPSLGEIGCALSHLSIYHKMLDEGLEHCCVLEDDLIPDVERFRLRLDEIEKWIVTQSVPTVVLLSCYTENLLEKQGFYKTKGAMFTEAYVINCAAAQLILKMNTPLCTVADAWGRWVKHGGLNLYFSLPPVAKQDWSEGFHSDVTEGRVVPVHRGILWYAKRLIGKSIDRIFIWLGL